MVLYRHIPIWRFARKKIILLSYPFNHNYITAVIIILPNLVKHLENRCIDVYLAAIYSDEEGQADTVQVGFVHKKIVIS